MSQMMRRSILLPIEKALREGYPGEGACNCGSNFSAPPLGRLLSCLSCRNKKGTRRRQGRALRFPRVSKKTPHRIAPFLIDIRPYSYGMRPRFEGISPRLKNLPPAGFLPSLRSGRPLRFPRGNMTRRESFAFLLCDCDPYGNLPRPNQVSTGHLIASPAARPAFRFPTGSKKLLTGW